MQNPLEPSKAGAVSESVIGPAEQQIPAVPVYTFPPIAGFWRRFLAWLVDSLLLGVTGQVIGLLFSSYLFSIGPYGRPIGLLFIIPYFGILNSKIGGGQTIGKRVLKIAVRNKNNEPIGLGRSILRILLLAVPAFLNGWNIPIAQNRVVGWFLYLLIFGLGGVILYTMVFNRKTRQGIHDLLLGTYVVHLPGQPIEMFPSASPIHRIISAAWIGITAIAALALVFITPSLTSKPPFEPIMGLYQALQSDPRFFSVGVNSQTMYSSNGKTSHNLIITAWYKGRLSGVNIEEIVNDIARTALETDKNIDQYDSMQIKITSAYDIGIASAHVNKWYQQTIEGWRKEILSGGGNGYVP